MFSKLLTKQHLFIFFKFIINLYFREEEEDEAYKVIKEMKKTKKKKKLKVCLFQMRTFLYKKINVFFL